MYKGNCKIKLVNIIIPAHKDCSYEVLKTTFG